MRPLEKSIERSVERAPYQRRKEAGHQRQRTAAAELQDSRMERFYIEGRRPLSGTVQISGAKNAALPAMAAALLTPEPVNLHNVPRVRDIVTMAQLLAYMNAHVETPSFPATDYTIRAEDDQRRRSPLRTGQNDARVNSDAGPNGGTFRQSACVFAGGLRHRRAPSGSACEGACTNGRGDRYGARLRRGARARGQRLRGGTVDFEKISVTGTENILMAAALADGETTIRNAAREPEIGDLADLLKRWAQESPATAREAIRVEGVERIAWRRRTRSSRTVSRRALFWSRAPLPEANRQITGCEPQHLESLLAKLSDAGAKVVRNGPQCLQVSVPGKLVASDVTTEEYPGFATDMQAQFWRWQRRRKAPR